MATDEKTPPGVSDRFSSGRYQILPATPDDAEAMHISIERANANNYTQSLVYPKDRAHLTSAEELFTYRVGRVRKFLTTGDALHLKVVLKDDPKKIVGHASWLKPGQLKSQGTAANNDSQQQTASADPVVDPPAAMDAEVHRHILAAHEKKEKEIWGDDDNHWTLAGLSVDPDYQRKGIATALMKEGLDRADTDGVPACLNATPEGALFYPSVGFRKVGEISLFDGAYVTEFHIRPAGGISKSESV